VLSIANHIDCVAQEKNLSHVGDLLAAELGRDAYEKYPFLYIPGNNSDACGDNVRLRNAGGSRYSTTTEAADSTGMKFQIFTVVMSLLVFWVVMLC
jgi:hypothetical protein